LFLRYENLGRRNQVTTKTLLVMTCDTCGVEFKRNKASQTNVSKNPLYTSDSCQKCWRKILNNRPEHKEKLSQAIRSMIANDPDWCRRNSESKKGINQGDKNGMKQPDARRKVSEWRKNHFRDEKNRKKVAEMVSRAWVEGKYDGVAVGKCKWFTLTHDDGTEFKVQGTWEKAFAEWLLRQGTQFEAHRGRISYSLDGQERNYYPDFYLPETDEYIEIKNRYHYGKQKAKFQALREQHPDLTIRLIFGDELRERGIL